MDQGMFINTAVGFEGGQLEERSSAKRGRYRADEITV